MEILTRSEAKAVGVKQFFTGKPCKNGHVAYRYTQSGTCAECINGPKAAVDLRKVPAADREALIGMSVAERTAIAVDERERRAAAVAAHREQQAALTAAAVAAAARMRDIKRELTPHKLMVYREYWPELRAATVAVTRSRYPELTDEDIIIRLFDVWNDSVRWIVHINHEDFTSLIAVQVALLHRRPIRLPSVLVNADAPAPHVYRNRIKGLTKRDLDDMLREEGGGSRRVVYLDGSEVVVNANNTVWLEEAYYDADEAGEVWTGHRDEVFPYKAAK